MPEEKKTEATTATTSPETPAAPAVDHSDHPHVKAATEAATGKPAETKETAADPPVPETPYYSGRAGDFKDQAELDTYISGLERKALTKTEVDNLDEVRQRNSAASLIPENAAASKKDEVASELWLTDPEQAASNLKTEIRTEYAKEKSEQDMERKFWDGFYSENEDLQQQEKLVTYILNRDGQEIKDMKWDVAKKHLAAETRKFVSGVKKGAGIQEEELPSGGSNALGASGAPTTKVKPKETKPQSFVEDILNWQEKKVS